MNLLEIAQDVAALIGGIDVPRVVIGSSANAQLGALIQRSAEELASRHDWTKLTRVHSFTPVAGSEQPNSLPADYDRLTSDTMWIGSEPVHGPVSPSDWARMKSQTMALPYPDFRIIGGNLWFTESGPRSGRVSYEYQSKNFVIHEDGTTGDRFTNDKDTTYLPERLLKLYTVAWWKQSKGFDYAEDMSTAERELERVAGADAALSPLVVSSTYQWPTEPYPSSPAPAGPINASGLFVKASNGYGN